MICTSTASKMPNWVVLPLVVMTAHMASSATSEHVLDILSHVNLSQGINPDEGAFNSLAAIDSVVKNAVEK
jgi:hypothetical protein